MTTRWWRRPWVAPLFVVTFAFLAFSLPPYFPLDADRSRLPLDPAFPGHFAFLVSHIAFGSIALVACCLQVWPWLRQKYPKVHRTTGRVYVLLGVLPAGLAGIVVGAAALTPGFSGKMGNITLAVVWLAVTFMGFRMARKGRYAEHRRWMIRSFALCTSIVVNRLWVVGLIIALQPFLHSRFGGDQDALIRGAVEAAIWLSWIVNLLIAEWWIERRRALPRTGRQTGDQAPDRTPGPTPEQVPELASR